MENFMNDETIKDYCINDVNVTGEIFNNYTEYVKRKENTVMVKGIVLGILAGVATIGMVKFIKYRKKTRK